MPFELWPKPPKQADHTALRQAVPHELYSDQQREHFEFGEWIVMTAARAFNAVESEIGPRGVLGMLVAPTRPIKVQQTLNPARHFRTERCGPRLNYTRQRFLDLIALEHCYCRLNQGFNYSDKYMCFLPDQLALSRRSAPPVWEPWARVAKRKFPDRGPCNSLFPDANSLI